MRAWIRRSVVALGLGAAIGTCVPAPASAGPVSIYPVCSARTLPDDTAAEARCTTADLNYEFRIIIFCKINLAEGYFYDYAVVSEWLPTTEVIRVDCRYSGWIVATLGPEIRTTKRLPF